MHMHIRASTNATFTSLQHLVPLDSSLTSIYDHSIFEAMSKVVQKLIPTLEPIENMLNLLKQVITDELMMSQITCRFKGIEELGIKNCKFITVSQGLARKGHFTAYWRSEAPDN